MTAIITDKNGQIQAEIYTYNLVIDLTDYISSCVFEFTEQDIIKTFTELTGYTSMSFHDISFDKNDNRLHVSVYYKNQVDNIFKELSQTCYDWFMYLLKEQISKGE